MAKLPIRYARLAALLLCLAAFFGPEARADTALLHEAIGLTGVAMWIDSGAPGMVLVVVRGRETLVQCYGETTKLPWAAGTVAAYSNVGFDLLADALAAAEGKDYPSLLRDRITGPLGMVDTGVARTQKQCDRLMTGSGIGGPGPRADTSAAEGSGGLYSSGDDMAL